MVKNKCSLEVSINGEPEYYVQGQEYTMNILKISCHFSNKNYKSATLMNVKDIVILISLQRINRVKTRIKNNSRERGGYFIS